MTPWSRCSYSFLPRSHWAGWDLLQMLLQWFVLLCLLQLPSDSSMKIRRLFTRLNNNDIQIPWLTLTLMLISSVYSHYSSVWMLTFLYRSLMRSVLYLSSLCLTFLSVTSLSVLCWSGACLSTWLRLFPKSHSTINLKATGLQPLLPSRSSGSTLPWHKMEQNSILLCPISHSLNNGAKNVPWKRHT